MIQLTQEVLLALILDASTRATSQAMAQFVAQHPVNPPPPSPRRSRELSSVPEEEEQRQEEVNSRGSGGSLFAIGRNSSTAKPFLPAILAEALPTGVKVSNLSEYDTTGDPQEHLDKFYAKIDWYDLSDAAYCNVSRTTLSKRALAWFNQLPAGTISSLEQLTQCFLHHLSMNRESPKTAAFLFTIHQKENEPLRDYMQRFLEAVYELPHVNHELLASIIQQKLLLGKFKESIAGKPLITWKTCSCGHKNTLGLRSRMLQTLLLAARERVEKRKENRKIRRNVNTYLRWGSHTTPP
ncbi:UNVERIFIED_CONTAM: hypothetical protein Sangu_2706000 [Sesamum angustifolium]|uniref:Retrotransposon gag domain-containing protein n=1 Tax=Sesamum angustifolium TaxID=2727405 RepID=A0AAW2IY87_9LAMI